MKQRFGSLVGITLVLWLVGASWLEALAMGLSLHAMQGFVTQIDKRIALLEFIRCIAALEILLVPTLTYWVFPTSMPVEARTYLRYAVPAFIAFSIGLHMFGEQTGTPSVKDRINRAKEHLLDCKPAISVLLVIGLTGFTVKLLVPTAPYSFSTLPFYCLFISAFYAWYAESRFRWVVISIVGVVLLAYTVQEGMFSDLFFWLALTALFLLAGRSTPVNVVQKVGLVASAVVLLLLIQSIKGEYRQQTWGYQRTERQGNAGLLADLVTDRVTHPEKLFTVEHVLRSLVRFNQGYIIGNAMATVPTHEPYANGEVFLSLAYPVVPRLLWPGKPQTGGYENIRRFTSLRQTENTSINLSPLGEGYVNFGLGGIGFALGYGLLLSGSFAFVFRLAERKPSLIFWIPMLFIGCLTMETDLLSTWGSLLNNAVFVGVLYTLLKPIGITL